MILKPDGRRGLTLLTKPTIYSLNLSLIWEVFVSVLRVTNSLTTSSVPLVISCERFPLITKVSTPESVDFEEIVPKFLFLLLFSKTE